MCVCVKIHTFIYVCMCFLCEQVLCKHTHTHKEMEGEGVCVCVCVCVREREGKRCTGVEGVTPSKSPIRLTNPLYLD
jgi:hypothetical protein